MNASGGVDLSDAVTILSYLFLGNPSELLPLCGGPPVTEVRRGSLIGVVLQLFALADELRDAPVPPSCGGSPEVCCPNGNPRDGCGPLQFELAEAPLVAAADPNRFPFTLRVHIHTASDLPITIVGVDCGVRINTAPGRPFAELRSEMVFRSPTPDDSRPVVFAPFTLESFEEEDVALIGDFGCSMASLGLGFFKELVLGVVENHFQARSVSGLCQPWVGCQSP